MRDKLRVLLVSGEPHAGERTWRNLLKSDASVDLVHFTILRPPEKQDGTPINELSLIAFPTRELFQQKIGEFQLIIFDRYARQGVLPIIYFDNITRYVRDGGAVLVAAGPDYASQTSLWRTPLDAILPAEPDGNVTDQAFRPSLTELGRRHPVTRGLDGAASNPPNWSEWFRVVDTRNATGTTVMQGPDAKPLLVLSREGEGRVALLLSDHIWLWARGFEGGGPHLDLLRRLSHWLMKEPDLEEEALRLTMSGRNLVVRRQTMADSVADVTLTSPSGASRVLKLEPTEPGVWEKSIVADELGLWRATDGKLNALVNIGPANPREFAEVTSTTDVLAPIANATGGAARRLDDGHGLDVPRIVAVRSGGTYQRRRLDRPENARRQRGARHRRAAGLRRPARAIAADRQPRRHLGARRPIISRHAPHLAASSRLALRRGDTDRGGRRASAPGQFDPVLCRERQDQRLALAARRGGGARRRALAAHLLRGVHPSLRPAPAITNSTFRPRPNGRPINSAAIAAECALRPRSARLGSRCNRTPQRYTLQAALELDGLSICRDGLASRPVGGARRNKRPQILLGVGASARQAGLPSRRLLCA